jgi:glycosyltransferase involved in cell wall biosynthesis
LEIISDRQTKSIKTENSQRRDKFPGRVGIIQRVLPAYRAGFFNALANACAEGVSVFAGQSRADESIGTIDELKNAQFVHASNWELFHPHAAPYLLWQGGLYKWLDSCDPDVLIVEANARYLSVRAALRWMHKRDRPVVGWGLGVPEFSAHSQEDGVFRKLQDWLWRSLILSFDGVIAYSQQGARQYQQVGLPAEKIFVAPNAVASRPESSPAGRPAHFDGRPRILFVGRLQQRKRIDNLLRACARLPENLQPYVWVVGDGPACSELQSLAAEIYPEAQFLGVLRGASLEPYFGSADLFVLPGTGGLAVQQAMAFGLPVIVAEGDGTQGELIRTPGDRGPGNGWIVPPNDDGALELALRVALSDVERLRKMGAESYRIVAEEYNLENMVRVFVAALSTIADKKN